MAKTPAERQAAYRQRHLKDLDGSKARLNVVIDHDARLALARLAKRHGMTHAALLERLIREAQGRELAGMSADETSAYYDAVTA